MEENFDRPIVPLVTPSVSVCLSFDVVALPFLEGVLRGLNKCHCREMHVHIYIDPFPSRFGAGLWWVRIS